MTSKSDERQFLARESPEDLQVVRTDGSFLFDAEGRQYVDFMMGWCVGNFGWGNAVLLEAAAQFEGPDYVYPGYSYAPWIELASLLVSISPGSLKKCFRATGGSEAVDLALQAAMLHTGRAKFVSVEGSYHGNTIGGLSVGSSEYREDCKNLLPLCYKVKPPLNAKSLAQVEALLKERDVAAFIMEPISINLGVLIPEAEFMTGLADLCRKYGTLLIMDEVATGFGRTGTLFASEQFGIEPDIMCVAKAITGGLGGMGAMIATAPVAKSMEDKGNFYSTYGWHPRSVTVATAALGYITRNRQRLLEDVAGTSEYCRERLMKMRFTKPASCRIAGLAIGVDFGDESHAAKIQAKCRQEGLLVSNEGESLLLLPALNIDQATAAQGLDILERCV
ncbi:class-III pyridoxal-phosphate-dependent aminotransferase [Noviherbaspirillum malthae]|jgi:acetylornithine/succinyldiaminopimelate/putrescine aminotransferase|uniref:class-III pyridoxal-phosphate-dependent aminotransferase n=1 Tax=Noviherbaspirillum malthae TaxID=1260987 RepID=UPI0018902E15|nr:aspartate aminotransferase family protein [Noviherbaspirillum malthae]